VELRAREDEGAKGVGFGERGEAGIGLTTRSLRVDQKHKNMGKFKSLQGREEQERNRETGYKSYLRQPSNAHPQNPLPSYIPRLLVSTPFLYPPFS